MIYHIGEPSKKNNQKTLPSFNEITDKEEMIIRLKF